jgi:hypothetical protein
MQGVEIVRQHAFDPTHPVIVEGVIWVAIAAAALKRFLAHMTQLLTKESSFERMCICQQFFGHLCAPHLCTHSVHHVAISWHNVGNVC